MHRIVVVDDHALFRTGLIHVLGNEPDLEIVGEAVDGRDAINRARDLQPDVVLLDINMPILDGISAIPELRKVAPLTKIVILTQSNADTDLYRALKAGVEGYLLKVITPEEIAESVRQVMEGQSVLSPGLAGSLMRQYASLLAREEPSAGRLSAREAQVLELLCAGLNNRDIAERLYISENTVKNHVRSILEKLGVTSRMQAVAYAMREGLVSTTSGDSGR